MSNEAASKFDPARAAEYQAQSRTALAGYDACHEFSACMLAAVLDGRTPAHILVVGAGGGAQEIVTAGALEPGWPFTAVDPSEPMLALAGANIEAHGLTERTTVHLEYVEDLPPAGSGSVWAAGLSERVQPGTTHRDRKGE